MIIASSAELAAPRRRRQADNPNRLMPDGTHTASCRTTYIGLDPNEMKVQTAIPVPHPRALSPMAFLVEQGAESSLHPHFHAADQFQIFVKGTGFMASHAISGVCIQYTGAYSSYGPILAGPEGLDYFTLRTNYLAKAWFMPASRDELRAHRAENPHREVFGDVEAPRTEEVLAAATKIESSTVIEQHPDGLAVWRYLVPAGQSVTGPDPHTGGGQFWMVLTGELDTPDLGIVKKSSCVFVSHEEKGGYVAKAGPKGLDILVAQFPRKEFAQEAA